MQWKKAYVWGSRIAVWKINIKNKYSSIVVIGSMQTRFLEFQKFHSCFSSIASYAKDSKLSHLFLVTDWTIKASC